MGQREVLTRIEELTADSEHVSVARHYHLGDRRTLTRADRSREDTDLVLSVTIHALSRWQRRLWRQFVVRGFDVNPGRAYRLHLDRSDRHNNRGGFTGAAHVGAARKLAAHTTWARSSATRLGRASGF